MVWLLSFSESRVESFWLSTRRFTRAHTRTPPTVLEAPACLAVHLVDTLKSVAVVLGKQFSRALISFLAAGVRVGYSLSQPGQGFSRSRK